MLLCVLSQAHKISFLWVGREDLSVGEGELKIRFRSTLRFRPFTTSVTLFEGADA